MTPERLAEIRARAEVGTGVFHFTCPSCGSAPGVRCYGNGPMPVAMTHQSRHALVDAVKQSAVIDRLELVAEVERLAAAFEEIRSEYNGARKDRRADYAAHVAEIQRLTNDLAVTEAQAID